MEQLTAMLLDVDPAAMVTAAPSTPMAIPTTTAPQPAQTAAAPETAEHPAKESTAEAAPESVEAWIETANCTTCDECTDLNDRIFQYDDEKLAFVADPKGGPFADIVAAAELCPVGIIHPGTPQDPNEPGLDALVAKAAAFS